ncbi:uncharacterized protein LOC121955648 [Plectropomus leopardus]|uniref:uncharacterized protein LOC121955648 n=1 Tax=Plectropomus leopardus TaxID=160734 RepID=UPI001C4C602B|nr:uncharacterized protein LOC121955648 [Plectropomus leopardus]
MCLHLFTASLWFSSRFSTTCVWTWFTHHTTHQFRGSDRLELKRQKKQLKMAEFRWIKMSLFLTVLLPFTAEAARFNPLLYTVRAGDDVTLPCGNVIDGQKSCGIATWFFSDLNSMQTVELVTDGVFSETARNKSDRLSVTEECSLVIRKVTYDDVGRYVCIQVRSERPQGLPANIDLSVVFMEGYKIDDEAMLDCVVLTFGQCIHTVKWLFRSQEVVTHNHIMMTRRSRCFVTVAIDLSSPFIYTLRYELFTCEVTHGDYVQVFSFRSQSSVTATTESTTEKADYTATLSTIDDASPGLQACAGRSALDYIMLVMRVAEILLITVITVLLFRAPWSQRPPDDNTVVRDGTVNYENAGAPSVSVRLR